MEIYISDKKEYFNIDGQIFLCKSVDVAIGDGETALTNNDFIEFPVSVGPQGPTGATGATGPPGPTGPFIMSTIL